MLVLEEKKTALSRKGIVYWTLPILCPHSAPIPVPMLTMLRRDHHGWYQTGTSAVVVWFCLEEEKIVRILLQYSSFQHSQRYMMFHHMMQEVILTAFIEFVDPQDVSSGQSTSQIGRASCKER